MAIRELRVQDFVVNVGIDWKRTTLMIDAIDNLQSTVFTCELIIDKERNSETNLSNWYIEIIKPALGAWLMWNWELSEWNNPIFMGSTFAVFGQDKNKIFFDWVKIVLKIWQRTISKKKYFCCYSRVNQLFLSIYQHLQRPYHGGVLYWTGRGRLHFFLE